MVWDKLIGLFSKGLDIVLKKSKDGEKEQELQKQKIDIFAQTISAILIGVFLMCVLASLFPSLAITSYWFNVFDKFINYLFS